MVANNIVININKHIDANGELEDTLDNIIKYYVKSMKTLYDAYSSVNVIITNTIKYKIDEKLYAFILKYIPEEIMFQYGVYVISKGEKELLQFKEKIKDIIDDSNDDVSELEKMLKYVLGNDYFNYLTHKYTGAGGVDDLVGIISEGSKELESEYNNRIKNMNNYNHIIDSAKSSGVDLK